MQNFLAASIFTHIKANFRILESGRQQLSKNGAMLDDTSLSEERIEQEILLLPKSINSLIK